jgi:hypothetical protein
VAEVKRAALIAAAVAALLGALLWAIAADADDQHTACESAGGAVVRMGGYDWCVTRQRN